MGCTCSCHDRLKDHDPLRNALLQARDWEQERDKYRAEAMELRVKVQLTDLQIQHNYRVAQQAMKDREAAILERNAALLQIAAKDRELHEALVHGKRLELQLSEAKEQEKAMGKALEEWAEMYGERTTLLLILHEAMKQIAALPPSGDGGMMRVQSLADEALAVFDIETGKKSAKDAPDGTGTASSPNRKGTPTKLYLVSWKYHDTYTTYLARLTEEMVRWVEEALDKSSMVKWFEVKDANEKSSDEMTEILREEEVS